MPMPTIDTLRGRGSRTIASGRWLTLVELLLLALLAIQLARLVWAVVTPVGSFGDWRGRQAAIPAPAARQALFAAFDPFYRTAGGAQPGSVVTSLALTLYGTRVNEGSGIGSAIIATPDGVQNSFAVGDEIMPGVILKDVAFDHVVIDRGGAVENIFLDQSVAAPVADPEGSDASAPESAVPPIPPGGGGPVAAEGARRSPSVASIKSDIGFAPRLQNGKVTGLVLSPKGPAFQSAGFQPGDIIAQVNGRPISSAADVQALQSQLAPGARISLSVERGAAVVPIALILQGQ
ncbi:PDZ domain-containing protein [Sphingobium phenoxybenzoativorans]|uniref:PDZ domain-containing protein n=1 Tax=Sphingobium phenoxybenzoativorans TaxID=1592790 RepID=A0A975KAB8_9SPHN|nr:type II secretion system protein N [Sphingobium phenoxybenzoativorans]QUT07716.1 PDZ domain-containing protein [Sphingobium phenoxybenzoativorans]